MIKKAILNGLQPERIAAALNKPMHVINKCMKLLDGISDEAAELLKDKVMSYKALCLLKRVTSVRQIEIAEYLVSSNNFTIGYVETMVLGTSKDQQVNFEKQKKKTGLSLEEIARLQQEMETVGRDFKAVEQAYAENMLSLTMIRGYAKKLLENAKITRFLRANYHDFLSGFERIVDVETL